MEMLFPTVDAPLETVAKAPPAAWRLRHRKSAVMKSQ
jgi:hypothetical protein